MRRFAVLVVVLAAIWSPGAPAHAEPAQEPWQTEVAPGLRVERIVRHAPDLVLHVARLAPGARYSLRPVLAHDRVGDATLDRQPVGDMCRRAGGIVCVNADFAACTRCRSPYGGVVLDGRVLRSFNPAHGQVSQINGHLTADMLAWGGTLAASYASWRELPGVLGQPSRRVDERQERDELPIAGVNIDPVPDGVVLYTPDWGGVTPATPVQVTIATPRPVAPGSLPAEVVGRRDGPGPLGNDSVLAATGKAAERLAAFADRWRHSNANHKQLMLVTAISQPAAFSVGGHPVLLRGGVRQEWDRHTDPKAIGRHPRTLLGWNAAGEILLITADGRQPGTSDGLTLDEAVDLLRSLGATEAMNLDGGGSTTFVGPCTAGPCVLNRPSDRRERLVPMALAIVGDRGPVRPVPQSTGAALLPPASPTADDAASTPHAVLPAPDTTAPMAAPGTTAHPTTDTDVAADRLNGWADAVGASRLFATERRRGAWPSLAPADTGGAATRHAVAATAAAALAAGGAVWARRRRQRLRS